MGKKIKIEVEPIGKRIYLREPANGLEALTENGIGVKSVCGGKGTCGKCRIIILNQKDIPLNAQEKKVLTGDEIKKGVRLACQQTFSSDLDIYIPSSSLTQEQKLQVMGQEEKIEVDPMLDKYYLKLEQATLEDMAPDFDRVKAALKKDCSASAENIDFRVLKEMPGTIRQNKWEITATLRGREIIGVEGGDKAGKKYGVAIDLGTTKIALLLIDLSSGKTVASKGIMNPQISYGEDVMSRLNFAISEDGNTEKIQKAAIDDINSALEELCKKEGIKARDILEMTVVGNTAMHHLFLGLPVRPLSFSPFVALSGQPLNIKGREVGINISPGAYIYLLPPIAGYVGSDHLAMLLATGIQEQKGNVIGIDIGTNTEICLKTAKSLTSVSTASGPAFEGAHIKYGMRAAPGAIERVVIEPESHKPVIQTIGDRKPAGICGSGILDAVAELRKAELINTRGKFDQDSKFLSKDGKGNLEYLLKAKDDGSEAISINQKDISEIQLAKGAMRAGIEILMANAGITFNNIDKIIIAGAFGSYIDPKNVVNIGMFPNVAIKKIVQVGNAAGVGAKMVLISREKRLEAERLARKVNYLELTTHPQFNDYFVKSMQFPEPESII